MKRKAILWSAAICLVSSIIAIGISAYHGSVQVEIVCYEVEANIAQKMRIVHLTDLHSKSYGNRNDKLVQLVAEQSPDMIFMTGDMLSDDDEGPQVVCQLISELLEIAPVYYGYGNHEKAWEARTGKTLEPLLTDAGATVLDCTYVDVTVNGQQLRIGGYHGYWRLPHMFPSTPEQEESELAFCKDFEDTQRLKLLLCHIPTTWLDWGYIDKFPAGVVFSGHYHGGQVRLPLIGGLYAPYEGALPKYTRGVFQGEQATCVLSAGVGSEDGVPRINNLPEIVVVDIRPET